MRRQQAVCFSGFLTLFFLSSFFFGSVHRWAYLGLAAALFFLFACFLPKWKSVLHLPKFFRASCLLTTIWIFLQSLCWSANSHESWSQSLLWLSFLGAFLLVQEFEFTIIRRLIQGVVAVAIFQVLYGYWQLAQTPESVLWITKSSHLGYLTGTYLNRNHCAGLLELGLGSSVGLVLFEHQQGKRKTALLHAFIAVFLLTALIRTGSRFGILSWSFIALAASLWAAVQFPHLRRILFTAVLVTSVLFIVQGQVILDRFRYEDGFIFPVSGRLWVWQDALSMLKDHGWVGIGLGGFERVFPQYQSARLMMGWNHAHQDYLELAVILGIPVFLVWIGGWMDFARGLIRQWSSSRAYTGLSTGLFLGLVSMAFHGVIDFNFAIPANAFIWIVLAACLQRLHTFQESGGRISS